MTDERCNAINEVIINKNSERDRMLVFDFWKIRSYYAQINTFPLVGWKKCCLQSVRVIVEAAIYYIILIYIYHQ